MSCTYFCRSEWNHTKPNRTVNKIYRTAPIKVTTPFNCLSSLACSLTRSLILSRTTLCATSFFCCCCSCVYLWVFFCGDPHLFIYAMYADTNYWRKSHCKGKHISGNVRQSRLEKRGRQKQPANLRTAGLSRLAHGKKHHTPKSCTQKARLK